MNINSKHPAIEMKNKVDGVRQQEYCNKHGEDLPMPSKPLVLTYGEHR